MKKTYTFSQQEIQDLVTQALTEVHTKSSPKFSWRVQEDKDRMDRSMGSHTVELIAEFEGPIPKKPEPIGPRD